MTVAVIPNRPLGSEARSITAILANFDAITKVINGEIDGTNNIKAASIKTANLENGSVSESKLSADVQALINAKVAGLTFVEHAASAEVKPGEFFAATKAVTATLPKCGLNTSLGIYNLSTTEEVKVKVFAGDNISGDFTKGLTEVTLLPLQHITLLGDSKKTWRIIGGEPKRTQVYSAIDARAESTLFTPSATRPVHVQISCFYNSKGAAEIFVGGVEITPLGSQEGSTDAGVEAIAGTSFLCFPGVSWEWKKFGSGACTVASSYLVL